MFLRLTVSLAALVATATANTSDLDEWKHTLTKDECIFRVIDAASGKKYSYDFSSHMNDLVHDSSNYELKLNLCAPVETACYPSTCSNHAPHGFEGTPCLPWNATENTGHMIVTSTEDGGPPDPVGTNYPKPNKCDPNKFDPKYTAGCPGPDDCCQKQCFSGTGQPEECTKACAVIASSEPYVQLQFPNKTKEGLQFTFNPVASGNDPRIPEMSQFNCGANGGKYFGTATVDCDEDPGATKMIILSVTNIGCFYQIRLKAKAACHAHPFVPIPVEPKGWSAFGVFVFIIFLGFLLYFVLGTMYNGIYGTMGWEIPHKHFWRSCATSCYGRVQSCCGSAMGSRSDYNDFGSNHYSVGKSNPVYQANPAEHTVVYDDL